MWPSAILVEEKLGWADARAEDELPQKYLTEGLTVCDEDVSLSYYEV